MWINVQPKLYWVTSRQAPEQYWVDSATTRAIHAFRNRDTSQYPNQDYLDHGDLSESYRSSYDSKTLPKGCIGKKGAAQEAQLRDCKVAHGREIDLKDRIIRSTKEDASKWQAIYMSSNKVDIELFQSFQNLLRSASSPPSKGASSSSNM